MMTALQRSITDERMPEMKGRVRATAYMMVMCCKPGVDANGDDEIHCTLMTHIDINGLVPKWVVNIGAKASPSQWFVDVQGAINKFAAGKYNLKPDMITDWKYGPMLEA